VQRVAPLLPLRPHPQVRPAPTLPPPHLGSTWSSSRPAQSPGSDLLLCRRSLLLTTRSSLTHPGPPPPFHRVQRVVPALRRPPGTKSRTPRKVVAAILSSLPLLTARCDGAADSRLMGRMPRVPRLRSLRGVILLLSAALVAHEVPALFLRTCFTGAPGEAATTAPAQPPRLNNTGPPSPRFQHGSSVQPAPPYRGLEVGPARYLSPRYAMPSNSISEGSKCVSITWRAISACPYLEVADAGGGAARGERPVVRVCFSALYVFITTS